MVYLIHFDTPLKHARHYIGWTQAESVDDRFAQHVRGTGATILRVCNEAGIVYRVVRTWQGGRKLERQLKNWKKARQLCPICKEVDRGRQRAGVDNDDHTITVAVLPCPTGEAQN